MLELRRGQLQQGMCMDRVAQVATATARCMHADMRLVQPHSMTLCACAGSTLVGALTLVRWLMVRMYLLVPAS